MKKQRVTAIELIRFIVAVSVMIFHFFTIYIEGDGVILFAFILVEFFFILSGFFMMKHVSERENPMSMPAYVLHKAASFYPVYMIVFAVQFVIFVCMNHLKSPAEVLGRLFHFKWEALLLQNAGFNPDPQFGVDYLLGQAWYLSAMLLALVIAYPLARYLKKYYLSVVCPLVILFVYSYIIQTLGTLNIGNEYFGVIMSAVLRGLAGTCVGSLGYAAYAHFREKGFTKKKTASVIEAACYVCFIALFFLKEKYTSAADSLFFILVFFLMVLFAFVGETPVSVFLNSHGVKLQTYLGSLSLYLYLVHWSVMSAMQLWAPKLNHAAATVLFFGVTLVLSVLLKCFNDRRKSIIWVVVIVCVLLLLSFFLPYWI